MTHFLFFVSGLGLITFETALIPRLSFIGHFFDLLLPWVLYLAAFRPVHDSLPLVLFAGLLMDSLSGGPFGLYLTSYVWLFILVRLSATVVRMENPMVLVVLLMGAVALQNGLFLIALDMANPDMDPELVPVGDRIRVVSEQIGWVLLTGPLVAFYMGHTQRSARRRARNVAASTGAGKQ
jgi:rod shape-determining protein MreD